MNKEYYQEVMKVLQDSINSIIPNVYDDLVDECVKVLKNGGKIIASGLGKNVPICEKFVGTMNSLGMDARFLHTNTAMHGDLGVIKSKDLLIVLSKSGNTKESVELVEHLLVRGTNTWLMTFSTECKLAKLCRKQLIMHLINEGDKWDIVPNNSTSVYLILLQGLALEIADKMGITLDDFRVNHPGGGIGAKLNKKNSEQKGN